MVIVSSALILIALAAWTWWESKHAIEVWFCPRCRHEIAGGERCPVCGEKKDNA